MDPQISVSKTFKYQQIYQQHRQSTKRTPFPLHAPVLAEPSEADQMEQIGSEKHAAQAKHQPTAGTVATHHSKKQGAGRMATNMVFGHVQGVPVGTSFSTYKDMNAAGIHRSTMGGISGQSKVGADSIVVSGGYKDDEDHGDIIVYTGQGGQDGAGRHVKDQTLQLGNAALVVSQLQGLPVRVIRGADKKNPFAPASGYRYDGLYRVESHWHDVGIGGFKIWRFRLEQLQGSFELPATTIRRATKQAPIGNVTPGRVEVSVQRIIRDTALSRSLKAHYNFECQICGDAIQTPSGLYAEAAHIRPLGSPHNGPDVWENILCLCPNHHTMFDLGTFAIEDDHSVVGLPGAVLRVKRGHNPALAHIKYHREHYLELTNKAKG